MNANGRFTPPVKLADVARVQSGAGFPEKHQGGRNLKYPVYKVGDMNLAGNETEMVNETNSISEETRRAMGAAILSRGSVIFPKVGGAIATNKKRLVSRNCCVDNNVMGVIPDELKIDSRLLFYFFQAHDLSEFANDAGLPSITKTTVENWTIGSIPPLPEQRRIVSILDEAFAGIATAKANAEKNLRNARALFESHLDAVFGYPGENWVETTIGKVIRFIDYRGKTPVKTAAGLRLITAKNVKMGYVQETPLEFVAPNSYEAWMTRGIPRLGDVLFTTEAPLANVAQLDTDAKVVFAQRIIIMQPDRARIGPAFLKYLLLSAPVQKRIRARGTGATVQGIKASLLRLIPIAFPRTIATQNRIVEQLDALKVEEDRLASIYQQKLAALDALKKSLLHQAFSAQLARNEPPVVVERKPVAPFPFIVPGISTKDLHAGILAIACELHESAEPVAAFTHVKAEKCAHMIEAALGIELGRTPVKDAAGPNDFNHLKKVEHRAKMTNAFDFKQVPGGAYRVTKLCGFQKLIDKTRTALGGQASEVETLLGRMVGMSLQQAEIFATVYAGWNNLLMDGLTPTDEEIVVESRENWHPDKMKIDRNKFFVAVKWMREQGFVPLGRGKRVAAKGKG